MTPNKSSRYVPEVLEALMAGSVNKVILVGNLGKDPEVRHTQSGSKIVSFTLATSDTWNDRQSGERRERTRMAPCRHLQ